MTSDSKLLWGEGLFLRPQHFQRQDSYHEARLRELANAVHPYAWGLRAARFDLDALANGTLRAIELSLILPDGEFFSAPGSDELPDALVLENLPANVSEFTFHAALPVLKTFGSNFSAADAKSASTRYVQADLVTPDLFTASDEAAISFLKKNIRLVAESEPREQLVGIPVVRVRRTSIGRFEIDPQFVPPSLSVRAAPALFVQLRRLLDALQAKVNALYGFHREPSRHVIEFRSGDIASFWLLHTASSAFASLSHLFHHPGLHPERLFQALLELAGRLMTFSNQYTLAELPVYSHAEPGPAFARLDRIIRDLLETVISTRYFSIATTEVKPSYHLGRIDSQKIDEKTTFHLGISSSVPAAELVGAVPLRFKIGAPDDVEKFVLSAMPGIRIVHETQVPAAIPVRPGHYYFTVEARGPMYERMLQSQSIMIYVPTGFPDLELELIAVT